jgi:LTXXQ motif family protein
MRRPIVSLMVLSAAVVGAQAQPGHGPGGGHPAPPPAAAAPHPAPAPPPHIAAPSPHIAAPARPPAPHVAMPHAPPPQAMPHRFSQRPANVQPPLAAAFAQHGRGGTREPSPSITRPPQESRAINRGAQVPSQRQEPNAQQAGPQQPGQNAVAGREGPRSQQQLGAGLAPGGNRNPAGVSPEPRNPAQPSARVTSRIDPQAARQGRFAAPFVSRSLQSRALALPVRDAWHHPRRAAFAAWAGPVFWPYVYTDMFYYTFWPTAYDDGYWAYAYDDLVDGTFWASNDPYAAYAYVGPNPATAGLIEGTGRRSRIQGASPQALNREFAAACNQNANVADWPFDQIQSAINLDGDQHALLQRLQAAAQQAADVIRQSCPSAFPLTPPGRLQAMITRLNGTLSAIDIIRPVLAAFYDSLTDEQKARFNAIGPDLGAPQERQTAQASPVNTCDGAKPGLIDVPFDQIEATVRPTNAQQRALDQLRQAGSNAINTLSSACPDVIPGTPVGRLEAMRDRFAAMLQAAQTMQPALSNFYASLNNEQKAAFNTLGQTNQSRG